MKRKTPHGFTLIEMITVVAIIIVLAGLIIGVAGFANKKAATDRATGEIKAMSMQLDAYKIDNGIYPRTAETDELDSRTEYSALSTKYQKANIALYSALTGDYEPDKQPDGKTDPGNKSYYTFERSRLNYTKDAQGGIQSVNGIIDPFGQYYGYSTAAAKVEEAYLAELKKNPAAGRTGEKKGFNSTFDLWSTAGATTATGQVKWIKNWSAN